MSELRSAIELYRRDVLAELPDARLEEDFAELQRAVEQIEAEAPTPGRDRSAALLRA